MKSYILAFLTAASLFFMTGCGNLSPRIDPNLDQKINNQNGKIDEIKNNQNGIMGEIGTLKNQSEIQNSKLDRVQQGMFNLQSNADNHGVQILSGTGGLVIAGIFGVIVLIVMTMHYRGQAQIHEKTANILAEKIVSHNNPELENAVFEAVLHTEVAGNVLSLIKRHQATFLTRQR